MENKPRFLVLTGNDVRAKVFSGLYDVGRKSNEGKTDWGDGGEGHQWIVKEQ